MPRCGGRHMPERRHVNRAAGKGGIRLCRRPWLRCAAALSLAAAGRRAAAGWVQPLRQDGVGPATCGARGSGRGRWGCWRCGPHCLARSASRIASSVGPRVRRAQHCSLTCSLWRSGRAREPGVCSNPEVPASKPAWVSAHLWYGCYYVTRSRPTEEMRWCMRFGNQSIKLNKNHQII
jgi:hypothetical protein